MDPRLIGYYNQELQHLREMGAEFALQFPKIAARLGMNGIEVSDPYVERLLEGVGFLAARVQMKLDAEFPRFTQRLLEIVYPGYLAPTPSMLIAQMQPDLTDGNLASGFRVPRGSAMRSRLGKNDMAASEFRTAHDVVLWPVEIVAASYFTFAPDLPLAQMAIDGRVRAGVRLRIRATAGLKFNQLALDDLRLYLSGNDEVAYKLHELALGACVGVVVMPTERPAKWQESLPRDAVRSVGFEDDEALLPASLKSFQGYRLVQEYFAFPQRFRFIDVAGVGSAFRRHVGDEREIFLLFGRGDASLESVVNAANFTLFCTPAINLFPKRADRVHVGDGTSEYHVVADRSRPMDFEVYEITGLTGYGVGNENEQAFLPLYAAYHGEESAHRAYYTVRREPRLLSDSQKRNGFRSSYVGSEVYVSLVDPQEAPFRADLRQLAPATLCTNRDLPLLMPLSSPDGDSTRASNDSARSRGDFTLETAAPVVAIRCVKGPSRPFSPLANGADAWRLISHLSLNYLSLLDSSHDEGAAAIRQMLGLYAATDMRDGVKKQIEGVRSIGVQPVVRRLPLPGPIAFGRGLAIDIEVDAMAFQGWSAFLFGSVMEQFFARYVSINSFTETTLRFLGGGEILQWTPRCGNRPIL